MTLFNGFADDFVFFHSDYKFVLWEEAKTLMAKNNGDALLSRRRDRFDGKRILFLIDLGEWLYGLGWRKFLRVKGWLPLLSSIAFIWERPLFAERFFETLCKFFENDGVFYDKLCAIEGFDAFRSRYFLLKGKSHELAFLEKALSIMKEESIHSFQLTKESIHSSQLIEETQDQDFSDRLKAPIAFRYFQ